MRLRCANEHFRLVLGIAIAATLVTSNAYGQTINGVTCSPSTIAGGSGESATCTVTLASAAPAGGTSVTLTSSLMELAALLPRVTVPAGQTQANFTVTTNANYRAYSGIGFSAAIGASANGSTRSATINVTAQPRPADFTSGSQASANTQWDGLMCGGIAPIGGRPGILYSCSPAQGTGFGTCTFQQECNLGCRRVPPNGTTFRDFCATAGPNAVSISRNVIVAGDRVPSSIVAEAPAGQAPEREQGSPGTIDPSFNASYFPHAGGISFPDGATSVPFEVATSYTPGIQFVDVVGFWFNASIPPFLITNGRAGHAWLVMLPPDPPPAIATPTLGDFQITGFNPVTGGNSTIGQIDLSGLSRAGGPTFTVTSSNPAVVPNQSFSAPANENLFGFQASIQTRSTSADTNVTLTASDGRYSFSRALTVRASPPPPVLADVVVDPTSVVGGNSAIGTVMLSAAQSGSTTVALSTPAPTTVARIPASITIPAGATAATFTVTTFAVSSQFNMNIFADLPGNPGQQALLLITPGGGAPAASGMAITPTSVVGGGSATGSVTLSAAAPSGGAVVTLSKALSNGGAGTVPATVPANVTVPAGQRTASFAIGTSAVTSTTNVRISGTFGGATANADVTLFPLLGQLLFNGNVPGGTPATGTVTLNGAAPAGGTVVALSSANPSLVTVPASITVPAGQTSVNFTASTGTVTQTTGVSVSASAAGTTVNGTVFLVVSRAVSSVTLNPSTVTGGVSSTATVTLNSANGGQAFVTLASGNTVLATVPNSVTVPSGQTSVTFSVNTAQVTSTSTVAISATFENVTKSATLTLNPSGTPPPPPPPSGQTATLTVSASGRTGERVTSSPSGINVAVGSSGSASFTAGTSITLSISNGRDAIWSGACSSGGEKRRTCTFTISGPASVSANVR